ncbi:MAG: VCBS repeat-containing protein, partial [Niameybacter sp.]
DENGNLRRATEGTLLGLTSLNPIDYDVNGEFNLASVQRVIGISNLDTLGLVETYLAWRNATNRFEPFMQYLSVLGNSL